MTSLLHRQHKQGDHPHDRHPLHFAPNGHVQQQQLYHLHQQQQKHEKRTLAITNTDSESESEVADNGTNDAPKNLSQPLSLPVYPNSDTRSCVRDRCSLELSSSVVPASVVLERILTFLRMQSMPCTYTASVTSVRIDCHSNGSSNVFDSAAVNTDAADLGSSSSRSTTLTPPASASSRLRFVVFLWQKQPPGPTESSDNAPIPILVQVQRRCGCAIAMQYLRRALFYAVRNGQNNNIHNDQPTSTTTWQSTCSNSNSSSNNCAPRTCPRQAMIPLYFCHEPAGRLKHCDSMQHRTTALSCDELALSLTEDCAVQRCSDLLASSCTQQQCLGMEALYYLTDPNGTLNDATHQRKTNTVLARALIDEPAEDFTTTTTTTEQPQSHWPSFLREAVLHHVLVRTRNNETDPNTSREAGPLLSSRDNNNNYDDDDDDRHALALQILTNALRAIAAAHQQLFPNSSKLLQPPRVLITDIAAPETSSFLGVWRKVLESCRHDIAHATLRPCVAALSTRLLLTLLPLLSPQQSLNSEIFDDDLMTDLVQAHSFGKLYHRALEQTSRELIDYLLVQQSNNNHTSN